MNELVAARHKAEEVHAAEAKRNHQAATIAQQADYIRESNFSSGVAALSHHFC